ncbi:protein of unknown function [Blastococcus saxobsidens DD2]|uniref:Uncharacterized protein n=1 Tax=Blastococcus saxobsidens (strain DD2) TaxID=1146883 RepID=H6RLJ1_BLASD|nr:protein of unknown function [Blastococcus saxobsidens DD2]
MSGAPGDVRHYWPPRRGSRLGAMPPGPALDIRGLTVRYGAAVAVEDLHLTIPRGLRSPPWTRGPDGSAWAGPCPGCCSRSSRSPTW